MGPRTDRVFRIQEIEPKSSARAARALPGHATPAPRSAPHDTPPEWRRTRRNGSSQANNCRNANSAQETDDGRGQWPSDRSLKTPVGRNVAARAGIRRAPTHVSPLTHPSVRVARAQHAENPPQARPSRRRRMQQKRPASPGAPRAGANRPRNRRGMFPRPRARKVRRPTARVGPHAGPTSKVSEKTGTHNSETRGASGRPARSEATQRHHRAAIERRIQNTQATVVPGTVGLASQTATHRRWSRFPRPRA